MYTADATKDEDKNDASVTSTDTEGSRVDKIRNIPLEERSNTEKVAPTPRGILRDEDDPFHLARIAVEEWESLNGKLTRKMRDAAVNIALLHVTAKRGATRKDFLKWYGRSDNAARKRIYELRKRGVVKEIEGKKVGRFKQYFLTTEIDRFAHKPSIAGTKPGGNGESKERMITTLIQLFSRKQPTFHKHRFYTEIAADLYDAIQGWQIGNKQTKVKELRLSFRRSATVMVSPNGTVEVYLESTLRPYDLCSGAGIIDLVADLGECCAVLKAATGSSSGIPIVNSWEMRLWDKDKTIPMSEQRENGVIIGGWSEEGIKVEYLGEVFQFYGKVVPTYGEALRGEHAAKAHITQPIDKQLIDAISPEIALRRADEEMLKRIARLERKAGIDPSVPDEADAQGKADGDSFGTRD